MLVEQCGRACGNCAKAGAFCAQAFASQRWKSLRKKLPKATGIDFHAGGSFHKPSAFFLFWYFFLSLWKSKEVKREAVCRWHQVAEVSR